VLVKVDGWVSFIDLVITHFQSRCREGAGRRIWKSLVLSILLYARVISSFYGIRVGSAYIWLISGRWERSLSDGHRLLSVRHLVLGDLTGLDYFTFELPHIVNSVEGDGDEDHGTV